MSTVMGTTSESNVIDVDIYARGEPGVGIEDVKFYYATSSSCTVKPPDSSFVSEFIQPEQGEYLWIKIEFIRTNGEEPYKGYTVAYFSIDGADGKDGGYYTPSVTENGTLSWIPSDPSLPPLPTANIQGPKGAVKFIYVPTLPAQGIEYDAFYMIPARSPTENKIYDEYFYNPDISHWEKLGEDLDAYYNKTQIDNKFSEFVATDTAINSSVDGTTYYLTGVNGIGNKSFYQTSINYNKDVITGKTTAKVDDEIITTNLFYSIG